MKKRLNPNRKKRNKCKIPVVYYTKHEKQNIIIVAVTLVTATILYLQKNGGKITVKGHKMYIVILTALGVGSATVFGAVIGFIFRGLSRRFSDIILSFAAGVMLCASVLNLILPSLENGEKYAFSTTSIGILIGVVSLDAIDRVIKKISTLEQNNVTGEEKRRRRVILFVTAIAIHNLPEGIAAGVGFGAGSLNEALLIAGSIALQNVPEGMVIIRPMISIGISPARAFFYAFLTGVIEVVGTILGYFTISLIEPILPFSLAFAGGMMLFVIADEIIPTTRPYGRSATYALIAGFLLMLGFNCL
jgi:ZIP family zinc transporter